MFRAAFLPWPIATVTVRSAGTMSPPAKIPGCPVIRSAPTSTVPPENVTPGTPSSTARSASWPSASTRQSAVSSSNSPVGCGNPVSSSRIFSITSLPSSACATVDSQRIVDAFLERLFHLDVVRGHPVPGAPVDDDGLGRAEPARGARRVHGGVPAAVDGDAAAEHRRRAVFHPVQQRHRVHDPGRVAGRDVGALADVRADGHERGVEGPAALGELGEQVGDGRVELERDAHVQDAGDLGVQDVARQPVLRDAVAHHAAGLGARVLDGHRVTQPGEVIGGRQPRGPGAYHQHPLTRRRRRDGRPPSLVDGLVAEEPLYGVDPDGLVELAPGCRRSRTAGSRPGP